VADVFSTETLVVVQRAKVLEVRTEFDVYDEAGTVLASVVQTGRDNVEKTLRPRKDDNLIEPYELRSSTGEVLRTLTRHRALKSSVVVAMPDGAEVVRLRRQTVLRRLRMSIEVGDTTIGMVKAESARHRVFVVADAQDDEVARIDKRRDDWVRASFTDADAYVVHVHRPLDDPMRSAVVAAAVAVDLEIHQD
jgi:uncharacterized protein YxjI